MRLIFFLIIVFCIYLLHISSFLVYDDLEANIQIFFSGAATQNIPLNHLYFSGHFPYADWFYIPLYKLTNGKVPVYELFMYFYMSISGSIIFDTIYTRLKDFNKAITVSVFLLTIPLFLSLVINLHHTIVAALLILSSFLLVINLDKRNVNIIRALLVPILILTLGFITRYQVGLLFTFLVVMSLIIFSFPNKLLRQYLYSVIIIVTVLYSFILIKRANSNDFIQNLDFYAGYQIGRDNIKQLSDMKTSMDSIKYEAVESFISDPENIGIQYYQSLFKDSPFWGYNLNLFKRACSIFSEYTGKEKYWIYIYLTLLGIAILASINDRKKTLQLLLFNALFWTVVFAIIYYIRMEDRLLKPMIFAAILTNLVNTKSIEKLRYDKKISLSFISILLIFKFIVSEKQYFFNNKQFTENNKSVIKEIESRAKSKIIVPGFHQCNIFRACIFPFEKADFSTFAAVYHADTDVTLWVQTYNDWVAKNCHCNADNLKNFFTYLQKQNAVFISDKERPQIIQKYLYRMNDIKVDFIPYDSVTYQNQKLYLFQIQ